MQWFQANSPAMHGKNTRQKIGRTLMKAASSDARACIHSRRSFWWIGQRVPGGLLDGRRLFNWSRSGQKLFVSLLYRKSPERGGGLQTPESIEATSFPGSLPGTVEQSLSVLGLVHEAKICDRCHDAGNLLLCIKHRYGLPRNTW